MFALALSLASSGPAILIALAVGLGLIAITRQDVA